MLFSLVVDWPQTCGIISVSVLACPAGMFPLFVARTRTCAFRHRGNFQGMISVDGTYFNTVRAKLALTFLTYALNTYFLVLVNSM